MKGKTLNIIALIAILAGVVLIIANNSIHSTGVVITGGLLFIVAGVFNLIVFDSERRREDKKKSSIASTFSLLGSIGTLILGLCMIIFQSTFALLIPFLFGIIVAFLALCQFYFLAIGTRPVLLPGWFYIAPVLLLGAAIYIFMRNAQSEDSAIMLATGISLALFGLVTLIEKFMASHARRVNDNENKPEAISTGKRSEAIKPLDVDYTDADSSQK